MGTADLTTFDALLKENYEGSPQYAMNNLIPFYQRAKKKFRDIENVGGKAMTVYFPIVTKRNHGVGARLEGETLPTARNVSAQRASVALCYEYGSIQLSGQVISGSKDKKHAFAEALDLEMKMMEEGLIIDAARQIHGDGSGVLAQVNGTVTATVNVTVNNPDTRWIEPGMFIDVWTDKTTNPGTKSIDSIEVVDVDRANSKIVLASAQSCNDDCFIYREDVRKPAGGKEITGLQSIVDDGTVASTIYGFTRATAGNNFTKGNLVSNSGNPLTEAIIQQAIHEPFISAFAGQGGATVALCDHQSLRYFAKIFTQKQRLVNTQAMTGGFSKVSYVVGDVEVEFMADRFAYPGYTYFLKEDVFEFAYAPEANWKWMDKDGAVLRKVSGIDAYEATIYAYWQMICRGIASQVRLYNYTSP